jgi:hypothetical protein
MPKLKTVLALMLAITLVVSGAPARAQHPAHMQPVHPGQQGQMHQQMMHQQQLMQQEMMRQQQAMMEHQQRMMMEHQQRMMMEHQQQLQQRQRPEHEAGKAAAPHGAASVPAGLGSAGFASSGSAGPINPKPRQGGAHANQSRSKKDKPQPSAEVIPPLASNSASGGPSASNTPAGAHPNGKLAGNHKHHVAVNEATKAARALAKHANFFLIWPDSSSVAYANLMNLKRTLDFISRTAEPTTGQRILLKNSLEAVTNSPRPAAQQVQNLANDIADTIAARGLPELDTRTLALQFRALMNGSHLSRSEIEQTLTDNRLVWSASNAAPPQIDVVAGDLQTIAMQFQKKPE